jgi:putative tryptophan/tyrosine transport system substrate-binding protein
VNRRTLIALLGGTTALAGPLRARAQQADRVRRLGVFAGLSENDPGMKPRLNALQQELENLGWVEGRNLRTDHRYAPAGARVEELAKELVALQPDVIIAHTVSVALALERQARAIPIVFVSVGDPFGAGLIASLARPGGNVTGFMTFEATISGKWVAMLNEVAPHLTRAMFLGDPKVGTYDYYRLGAEDAARALHMELVPAPIESVSDIERSIEVFAREPDGAMVVPPDPHDRFAWQCYRRACCPAAFACSMLSVTSLRPADLCLTALIVLPRCGKQPLTWIASCAALLPATCLSRRQPNSRQPLT